MQNVTLDEVQAGFLARNIGILGCDVRKMCLHANLHTIVFCVISPRCEFIYYKIALRVLNPTLLSLIPLLLSAGTILNVIVPSEFC